MLVHALLVVLFRLTGKRGLASMDTVDVIVVLMLALVAVNALVDRLVVVSPLAQRSFEGTPTTVIRAGRVVPGALRRLGLPPTELDTPSSPPDPGGAAADRADRPAECALRARCAAATRAEGALGAVQSTSAAGRSSRCRTTRLVTARVSAT
ncbi:MAG: hypothetical protein JWQ53_3265 [Klenkia sp.]|nr:hypothetical protein [Klenkia sp.]